MKLVRLIFVLIFVVFASSCDTANNGDDCSLIGDESFCSDFCAQCEKCHEEEPYDYNEDTGFAEGACYDENEYGTFTQEDCMAGCTSSDPFGGNLPENWCTLSCSEFDQSL